MDQLESRGRAHWEEGGRDDRDGWRGGLGGAVEGWESEGGVGGGGVGGVGGYSALVGHEDIMRAFSSTEVCF